MGEQRAEAIANMEAMGFERSQIDAAMRAAFYNPERAVEYLLGVGFDVVQISSSLPVADHLFRASPNIFSNPLPPPVRPLPPPLPLLPLPLLQQLPLPPTTTGT